MPSFKTIRMKIFWVHSQKIFETVHNIESVSVQIKDIKMMRYSNKPRLMALYNRVDIYSNGDKFVTIVNEKGNSVLIYDLITADWLIDYEDLQSKIRLEIEEECSKVKNRIITLEEEIKRRKQNNFSISELGYKLKLYQYKLSCLKKYIDSLVEEQDKQEHLVDGGVNRERVKKDI